MSETPESGTMVAPEVHAASQFTILANPNEVTIVFGRTRPMLTLSGPPTLGIEWNGAIVMSSISMKQLVKNLTDTLRQLEEQIGAPLPDLVSDQEREKQAKP